MNGATTSVSVWFQQRCLYLDEVPGAIKAHLNTEELVRVAVTSITAGLGLFGTLQALALEVGTIFPAPSDAALAAALLAFILEIRRRLNQGREPPRELRQPPSRR